MPHQLGVNARNPRMNFVHSCWECYTAVVHNYHFTIIILFLVLLNDRFSSSGSPPVA